MLDGYMRKIIDPPLGWLGRNIAKTGLTANAMTLIGLGFGLGAALAISQHMFMLGLVLLLLSRLADGLDGAIARASRRTDFGGYLDISADFLFYGAIPFAFVAADPTQNALVGAFLLLAFYFNGGTFLGYAILAEKHGLTTSSRGAKSLYFTGGLLEGTETILFFVALCIWPQQFVVMAAIFGTLCMITAITRLMLAYQVFGDK